MSKPQTLKINDVEYVRKDSVTPTKQAENKDGLKYVVIRARDAGVFLGYLKKSETVDGITNVVLLESRRLFYWTGAATLSQIAVEGSSKPSQCKIPVAIPLHEIKNVIETIYMTEKAKQVMDEVPLWKA